MSPLGMSIRFPIRLDRMGLPVTQDSVIPGKGKKRIPQNNLPLQSGWNCSASLRKFLRKRAPVTFLSTSRTS